MPDRLGAAAVQLRTSGASFTDIATTLGFTDEQAAVRCVINELAQNLDGDRRDNLRAEISDRIMDLLTNVWGKATDSTDPEHLPAVRTAAQLIDRFTRLHGLDAPTEIAIHTPTQTEIDAWVAGITARSMPNVIEADVV